MGSPLSPVIANLYMENLESRALADMPTPPKFYMRYVDDIDMICRKADTDSIIHHLNSQDPAIGFTVEKEDGCLPFLDALQYRGQEGEILVKVYRKKTHTDQYLHFESEHPIEHKLSVVNTLIHRANTISTSEEEKISEKENIRKALNTCGYPNWVINKGTRIVEEPEKRKEKPQGEKKKKGLAVIPYVKGLGEKIKRILKSHNVATAFKPHTTLRSSLVAPKDKIKKDNKTGVVYHIKCKCGEDYIGETERQFKDRFPEHHRRSSIDKSAMATHIHGANHAIDKEFSLLDQEENWHRRGVKEAINIRRHRPTLNRDEGRYQLSHVWDRIIRGDQAARPAVSDQ